MSREMTNSEAISNLNHIYGIVSSDIQRSLDLAIKALEERPQDCSDCKRYDFPYFEVKFDKEQMQELVDKAKAEVLASTEITQGEWIPVSERLPNNNEYIKNNGLFNVSDGNRSYSEWFDIYDTQKFGEPTMTGFRVDCAVTAWQPLPEPYKEGGEE